MQFRRIVATVAAVAVASTGLVACNKDNGDNKKLVVGTTDGSKKAWGALEDVAKEKGIKVQVKNFSDYNTPNQALSQKELDTNNFQHLKFLSQYNVGNNTHLVPIVSTEIVPLALFWKDHKDLNGIDGKDIAVPNDPSNLGRAINVLVQAKLVTLKQPDLITPTQADIDESKSKVKIKPVDAAQTPSAYGEGTPAIINNSFLDRAGIDPKLAVFQDNPNSKQAEPYINAFVVREEDKDNPKIKELAELWHDPKVQAAVAEDSKGTSIEVKRSPEEMKQILDRLEADQKNSKK